MKNTKGNTIVIMLLLTSFLIFALGYGAYKYVGRNLRKGFSVDNSSVYTCQVDSDCQLVVARSAADCSFEEYDCQPDDYSQNKWIGVNKTWYGNTKTKFCPVDQYPRKSCFPKPINDNYRAKCDKNQCRKDFGKELLPNTSPDNESAPQAVKKFQDSLDPKTGWMIHVDNQAYFSIEYPPYLVAWIPTRLNSGLTLVSKKFDEECGKHPCTHTFATLWLEIYPLDLKGEDFLAHLKRDGSTPEVKQTDFLGPVETPYLKNGYFTNRLTGMGEGSYSWQFYDSKRKSLIKFDFSDPKNKEIIQIINTFKFLK